MVVSAGPEAAQGGAVSSDATEEKRLFGDVESPMGRTDVKAWTAFVLELLRILQKDAAWGSSLRDKGVQLGTFTSLLRRVEPDFSPEVVDLHSMKELVQRSVEGTAFAVARREDDPHGHPWIVLRNEMPDSMLVVGARGRGLFARARRPSPAAVRRRT
jgi:hypothetical protein